jgi:hypothetical protein
LSTTQVGKDDVAVIVRACVRRHFGLFAAYREISIDDLCQEMWIELRKAWHNYDPERRLDTFVNTVVQRKMINKARDRGRAAVHEDRFKESQQRKVAVGEVVEVLDPIEPEPETFEGEIVGGDGQPLLVDWLGMVYKHAKRLTKDYSLQGHTYEPAQALAVAAIARKLVLSVRGVRGLFEDRLDLCRVIGFVQVPSHGWFQNAVEDGVKV